MRWVIRITAHGREWCVCTWEQPLNHLIVKSEDKITFSPLSAETPDVYIVERLFSSSLVVVVSTATPKRMNIYHFKKGTEICNYSYPSNILAVKLNRQVKHLLTALSTLQDMYKFVFYHKVDTFMFTFMSSLYLHVYWLYRVHSTVTYLYV